MCKLFPTRYLGNQILDVNTKCFPLGLIRFFGFAFSGNKLYLTPSFDYYTIHYSS